MFTPEAHHRPQKNYFYSKADRKNWETAIPFFLTEGRIPKADQNPDPWVAPNTAKEGIFIF